MKINKGSFLVILILMFAFGALFSQVYSSVLGNGHLSDEDVYEAIKEDYEFFIKVQGLEDKTLKEFVVHMDNHKERIILKINAIKPRICNGSLLL